MKYRIVEDAAAAYGSRKWWRLERLHEGNWLLVNSGYEATIQAQVDRMLAGEPEQTVVKEFDITEYVP